MRLLQESRPQKVLLGIALIVGSVFLMSFGDALVKSVSSDFTLWQLYVVRSLVAVPLILVLLGVVARNAVLRPASVGWTLLRSLLLTGMWIGYYAALPRLSLAVAATAVYSAPLFIAVFSALLIGEPVGMRRWLAVGIGFFGVLAILRPGTEAFSLVTLLPLLSAVFYASAMVITRSKCVDDHPLSLSLALNLTLLVAGLGASGVIALWGSQDPAVYPFLLGDWAPLALRDWAVLALLAVLLVAFSVGTAKAYQSGPPVIIATFDYAYLAFAALWGLLLFADLPDAWTVVGMVLIAGAGLLAIRPTAKHRTRAF